MKKIKFDVKKELPLIFVVIAVFAISMYFYPELPDKMPTHWNFKGEIDGYSGKLPGAFTVPGINLIMYVMFLFMPVLDPKRENYRLFEGTYLYFRYLFHIFFAGLQVLIIMAALGYNVDTGKWVILGTLLLFMLMGNVMGRLKHNYFVGIKTPWTLASEEVWIKTHRLGAMLWTCGGLIGVVLTVLNINLGWIFIAILIFITLIPAGYSYILFNRLKK